MSRIAYLSLLPLALCAVSSLEHGASAQTFSIERADCRGWLRSSNDLADTLAARRLSMPASAAAALVRCVDETYGTRSAADCEGAFARFQEDARRDRELAVSEAILGRFRESCPALSVPPPSHDRAQERPSFREYYARPYLGRVVQPRLASAADRSYRTRIREAAARQRTDFAGNHVVFQFGCGSDCHAGGAIDARTGTVVWFPFVVAGTPEIDDDDRIDYRLDSRILLLRGRPDMFLEFPPAADYYFEFDGRRFTLIRMIPRRPLCQCDAPGETRQGAPAQ